MNGSDYRGIGEAVNALFNLMFVLLWIFVPLGIWKLIEIIIWVFAHMTWS